MAINLTTIFGMIDLARTICEADYSKKKDFFWSNDNKFYLSHNYGFLYKVNDDLYLGFDQDQSKKRLGELVRVIEELRFHIFINFNETVKIIENVNFQISTTFNDTILVNENLDFLKESFNSFRINDWVINGDCINGPWVPYNQKEDGLTISELINFFIQTERPDSLAIQESLSFICNKVVEESLSVLESVSLECFTIKQELVTMSESLSFILISGTEINGSLINEATI